MIYLPCILFINSKNISDSLVFVAVRVFSTILCYLKADTANPSRNLLLKPLPRNATQYYSLYLIRATG